jgi:hypothetical protein
MVNTYNQICILMLFTINNPIIPNILTYYVPNLSLKFGFI